MQEYEVLIYTKQNSFQLFYFKVKNIKKVFKKIKKLELPNDALVYHIKLILDSYARVTIAYSSINSEWTFKTYYQGSIFSHSFNANLELDEEEDFDRALDIAIDTTASHFNIDKLLIVYINNRGMILKTQ